MAPDSLVTRALSWILTPLFLLVSLITLLVWHPIIWVTRRVNPQLHSWWVCLGNGCLLFYLKILGTRVRIEHLAPLPPGPLVVVSNHQSFYDIPLLLWGLRERFPRFVAKRELGRGLPSVSSVLRLDGSALVDRKDPHQAIAAVKALGKRVASHGWTACIFPEGTRSRDGAVRPFKPAGLLALLAEAPQAAVVPVTISGSWGLMRSNFLPVPWGVRVTMRVHPAIPRVGDDKVLVETVEGLIRGELRTADRNNVPQTHAEPKAG